MFSVDEKAIVESQGLHECLTATDPAEATILGPALEDELSRRTPDLTRVLLCAADSTGKHGLALGRTLTVACCRVSCTRPDDLHPGTAIEVRIPPWATVQASFEDGPKRTRGTSPNAVEMELLALLGLATGQLCRAEAEVKVSGS